MNALYSATFVVLLLVTQKEDHMSCIASCFASLQQHDCMFFLASSVVYQTRFANIGTIKMQSLLAMFHCVLC